MRVLALDYGAARCGVAISDRTGTLATPLDHVVRPATKKGMQAITDIARELEAERVVVGLPLSLSGGETEQTAEAREFAARLDGRLRGIPVELYDERLTTKLAERTGGLTSEDSRAAAHLLDSWLQSKQGLSDE